MKQGKKGFTLLELMIAVAIMAILVTISVPMFVDQLQKSRRYDGTSTLLSMEQEQALYRTNNTTYGTLAQVWGGVATTPGGRYTLTITTPTSTGYVITATAVGDQANDDESGVACTPLMVTATSLATTRTPAACW
tara:strand:+ start:304 stop:708 length:405 start_codon:yes stop_codon:yes gene_type:complete